MGKVLIQPNLCWSGAREREAFSMRHLHHITPGLIDNCNINLRITVSTLTWVEGFRVARHWDHMSWRWDSFFCSALLVLSKSPNLLWQWPADTTPHILPRLEGSLGQQVAQLMLLLPWNLFRFSSLSLELSPPKNMSDLMDLAFPNLFTALAPAGLEEIGAGDDLWGLIIVEFYSIDLYVCWLTCYQIRSLKEHKYCQQELNHPSLITSFSISSKSSKN